MQRKVKVRMRSQFRQPVERLNENSMRFLSHRVERILLSDVWGKLKEGDRMYAVFSGLSLHAEVFSGYIAQGIKRGAHFYYLYPEENNYEAREKELIESSIFYQRSKKPAEEVQTLRVFVRRCLPEDQGELEEIQLHITAHKERLFQTPFTKLIYLDTAELTDRVAHLEIHHGIPGDFANKTVTLTRLTAEDAGKLKKWIDFVVKNYCND